MLAPLFALSAGAALAQDATSKDPPVKPGLTLAPVLLVEPEVETSLEIRVGPDAALPRQSFVRVRGLPLSAKLSEGHQIAPGSWAIPLAALATLKLMAPVSASGRNDLVVTLLTIDGATLAEAKSSLVVAPAWLLGSAANQASGQTAGQTAPAPAPNAAVASTTPAAPPLPRSVPLMSSLVPALVTPPAPAAPPPAAQPTIPQQLAAPPPPAAKPAAQQPPAKPAPPPLPSPADAARAQQLVYQGDQYREQGNIAAARQFYRRAADIGLALAALRLGATYDGAELAQMPVRGIQPDPAEARKWYELAHQLGAPEASSRISRLPGR